MIDSFHGERRFLSNFYPTLVHYDGLNYPTAEHAYQAAKSTDNHHRLAILGIESPGKVKRYGRGIKLRHDWEFKKVSIMYDIVFSKFYLNHNLALILRDTGKQELVEGNNWGDTFWGVCNGEGQNWLGKILMNVRSYYQYG